MPVIGEELRALLGMIPVRDRAGIARGNLAQETLANEANAEGRSLLQQVNGATPSALPTASMPGPPPLAIPPGMGTGRPGPADPDTTGSVEPQPTRTTTVTAPPAGAAAQFEGEMARRAKMAGVNDIVSSLGLIINGAANRGASQGATRDTLLAGMGSGGMSVPEVIATDKHRQELIALDEARRNRENRIQAYQRETGADRERATAAVDTGNDVKALDPATIKTRAGDKLVAGSRERILADPKLLKQMADDAGVSVEMMAEKLKAGDYLDTKTQADVAQTRGATAKAAVDAERIKGETAKEREAALSFEEARKDPVEFAKRYPQLDTPEKVTAALTNRPTYEEFTKHAIPNATPHLQEWAQDEQRRKQLGLPSQSLPDFVASMQPKHVQSAEEKGTEKAQGHVIDMHAENLKKARDLKFENENSLATLQELWSKGLKSGSKFSEAKFEWKKAVLESLGQKLNKEDANTELFFTKLKEGVIGKAGELKGPLSDSDRKFIESLNGSMQVTPQTINRLLYLKERANNMRIAQTNRGVEEDTTKVPALKALPLTEYPVPNRFMREEVNRRRPGMAERAVETGDADDPKQVKALQADFEKEFGPGVWHHLVNEARAKRGVKP